MAYARGNKGRHRDLKTSACHPALRQDRDSRGWILQAKAGNRRSSRLQTGQSQWIGTLAARHTTLRAAYADNVPLFVWLIALTCCPIAQAGDHAQVPREAACGMARFPHFDRTLMLEIHRKHQCHLAMARAPHTVSHRRQPMRAVNLKAARHSCFIDRAHEWALPRSTRSERPFR